MAPAIGRSCSLPAWLTSCSTEVGEAVVRVLRALDVEVEFDAAQTCCGQPAFNSGYWKDARPVARRLLGQLDPDTPGSRAVGLVRGDDSQLLSRTVRG